MSGVNSSSHIPIPSLENRADGWRPAPGDISATPGGTMWAMTPGGTKLQWTRTQLMHYANSPLSKSPLHLPRIPGVTMDGGLDPMEEEDIVKPRQAETKPPMQKSVGDEDPLFQMDE